jgi:hypothetical protein
MAVYFCGFKCMERFLLGDKIVVWDHGQGLLVQIIEKLGGVELGIDEDFVKTAYGGE